MNNTGKMPPTPSPESEENRGSVKLSDPNTWVDIHGDYLYRVALTRVRNAELAEDMVQETFLLALKARHSFRGESSERTWMVGIMKHRIIDHYRKHSRFIQFSQQGSENSDSDFHTEGIRKGYWREDYAPAD